MSRDDRVAVTPGIARLDVSPGLAGPGRLWLVTHHAGALPGLRPAAPALIGDDDVYVGVPHSGTAPETVRALGPARRRAIAAALTDAADAVLSTVVPASGPRSGAMPSASPNSPTWTAS
ncbi:hypothetical protein ACWGDT_24665 [Streptomyces avermitilis]